MSRPDSNAAALPSQIAHYRIIRQLGQGGMGTVYLAQDEKLNRQVALKICHVADKPDALARFRREAQAMASLRHANLCPVHDFDVHDGISYLTMAFIEGPTLDHWVQARGGVTPRDAAILVRKLALALHAAHEKGVIHRDLKPSNIAMDKNEPIVLDFGLARQDSIEEKRLTKDGSILGTPSYMAPEQVKGDLVAMGPASDIYSLGVVFYELLTGRVPFDGPTMAVLARILTEAPPTPRSLRPDLDPALEAICLRCLAKKPNERWGSMQDFAKALYDWARQAPASGARVSEANRKSERTMAAEPPPLPQPLANALTPTLPATEMQRPLPSLPRKQRRDRSNRRILPWAAGAIVGLLFLLSGVFLIGRLGGSRPGDNIPTDPHVKGKAKGPSDDNPAALEKEITNSIGMKLVLIPARKFLMGSPASEAGRGSDEEQHEVTITKPYYLGKYEVTRGEFRRFVESENSVAGDAWRNFGFGNFTQTDDHPVVNVSWTDATAFCAWLSKKEGVEYRLPTEAEWEYACRAGTTTRYSSGDEEASLVEVGNAAGAGDGYQYTAPVGRFRVNPFGLCDMHGNVWEWCEDWYEKYPGGAQTDPTGPAAASLRVFRGGGWDLLPVYCRSADRGRITPGFRRSDHGFRVARVPSGR